MIIRWLKIIAILVFIGCNTRTVTSSKILMVTLAGTRSHKIPFLELARGLTVRGHNITFVNAFPNEQSTDNMVEEVNPTKLVAYVQNFTNWDLLGRKLQGKMPVDVIDIFKFGYQVCDAFLSDAETRDLMKQKTFDLLVLDGAYPECALGLAYHYKTAFIYLNTVAFYTGSISLAGSPTPYSVTPYLEFPYSDNMNLLQRLINSVHHSFLSILHSFLIRHFVHRILRTHIHRNIPSPYDLSRNVSLILQNGHFSMTYPRPYLPTVVEIACIHCRPPRPLPKDIENFINAGEGNGFIYVAMGSSVREENMPKYLRELFIQVFQLLPYQVLWKWESTSGTKMRNLPANVMLSQWFPQQDLLGHSKIKTFVSHGGLLSLFETVYHKVPVVAMPVFCDHDANVQKAVYDGYAIRLEWRELTVSKLFESIITIINDPRYKRNAYKRSILIQDQVESPLKRAVYWTEYILRHNGAYHMQSPAKDMSFIHYYLIDVFVLALASLYVSYYILRISVHFFINNFLRSRNYYIKFKIS